MKKFLSLCVILVLLLSLLTGCGSKPATTEQPESKEQSQQTKYQDGIYFAQEDNFNEKTGWKYVVTLEVKDGKIVKADWNGANRDGGPDKKTRSKNGQYPMVEQGGAQAPWHEQAAKVEAYLLETQDPTAIEYKDEEGHTDAITGVSIHVKEFFDLAQKALEKGPVGRGKYKDGHYHAEEKQFDEKTGWKNTVDLTVINGYIVAANWNAVHKDGGDDKETRSINGQYPMVEQGGAKAPWHEQATKVEAYLLETQDPTAIEYKDEEGHTDAISGVSIHVKEFFELAQEALADAK
jgi:major membrane immunogen (membrane-anchored lipoprotein)